MEQPLLFAHRVSCSPGCLEEHWESSAARELGETSWVLRGGHLLSADAE